MARSADQDPLRLLVVASEADAGEAVASVLRQEGRAVRLVRTQDLAQVEEILRSGVDVVLLGVIAEQPMDRWVKDVAGAIARVDDTIALVGWLLDDAAAAQLNILSGGARRVAPANSAALTAVILRTEWEGVQARRDQRDLKTRLAAAYARCNALIDSARSPLAYFHEGIFLRGNEAWRRLMRADSDEDLEGVSLLDLVGNGGPAAVEQMRTLLKTARANRQSGQALHDIPVELDVLDGTTVTGRLEITAAEYEDEPCLQAMFFPGTAQDGPIRESGHQAGHHTGKNGAADSDGTSGTSGASDIPGKLLPGCIVRPGNGRRAVLDLVPMLCGHPNVQHPVALFVGMHQQGPTLMRIGINRVEELDMLVRGKLEEVLAQHQVAAAKTEAEVTTKHAAALVAPFGDHWIVLGHLASGEAVTALARDLAGAFAHKTVDLGGHSLVVGLSVGGAILNRKAPHHENPSSENSVASGTAIEPTDGNKPGIDMRPGLSKGWGRFLDAMGRGAGTALVYDPHAADNAEIQKRQAMQAAIREAMAHDRFLIRYQPLISLNGSDVDTYEMLVHVADPHSGAPLAFGPWLVDHTDTQRDVDRWIVEKALAKLAKRPSARRVARLIVTIGAASLADGNLFSEWLGQELTRHGVAGSGLMIQVHEEVAIGHVQPARNLRNALKTLNVAFGIDHVGDGAQSDLLVAQMMEEPAVDFLKLGRTLMGEISGDKERQNKVRALVAKTGTYGGQIVGEHVESATTLAALYQLGVALAQGSFLSDPLADMNHEF